MRLTPKSVFLALVAAGLPFAVTIGWALGETTSVTPPAAATPDGIGGLGAAPERKKPISPVDYPERTSGGRSASSPAPVAAQSSAAEPSRSASSIVPAGPPMTEPPVPATSTDPGESTPSPAGSANPSELPSGVDGARIIRNS